MALHYFRLWCGVPNFPHIHSIDALWFVVLQQSCEHQGLLLEAWNSLPNRKPYLQPGAIAWGASCACGRSAARPRIHHPANNWLLFPFKFHALLQGHDFDGFKDVRMKGENIKEPIPRKSFACKYDGRAHKISRCLKKDMSLA